MGGSSYREQTQLGITIAVIVTWAWMSEKPCVTYQGFSKQNGEFCLLLHTEPQVDLSSFVLEVEEWGGLDVCGDHQEPVAACVGWQQGQGISLRSQEGNGSCQNCSHPQKQRQPLGQPGDETGVMKQMIPLLSQFLSCFYPIPSFFSEPLLGPS